MASFVQSDSNGGCAAGVYCSGGSTSFASSASKAAVIGGGAGSTPFQIGLNTIETNRSQLVLDYGNKSTWAGATGVQAGTATINLNITTAAGVNMTVTAVYLCKVDSGCSNISTVGSVTGLSTSLTTTGVKTFNPVIGSDVSFDTGEKLLAVFLFSTTSSHTPQFVQVTPDQTDTIPLIAGAAPTRRRVNSVAWM